MVNSSIPKAVPSAVAYSASNSVPVLQHSVLGPYQPATGSSINPVVPRTDSGSTPPPAPLFTGGWGHTAPSEYAGSAGAPSVPVNGFLFTPGPIDQHYTVTTETRDPYSVNHTDTVGWRTREQAYRNHIAFNQNVTRTGFKVNGPQQRTSVALNTLPPVGLFGTQTYTPHPQPQAVAYNRIRPATGTDQYGTGVLNSDRFGAGQVAGGIGGNRYTPEPSPVTVTPVTSPPVSAEPTWG